MKKALLGVLALTSVASFADVTGYVKSNSEVKAETDVKKEESAVKFEAQKYPVKTKLDLGFFLDSNKDTFLFTGTRFSGNAIESGVDNESYAGFRFDSKLNENSSLILNAVAGYNNKGSFDKKDKSIENALKEHLDAKKVWTADKKAELNKKDKEDDRNNFYKDNGFRLTENDRLLLSAVVKNDTETSNVLVGTIYNLDKDTNNRLESFVKAGKQLDGFRLDAELTHVLGKDKELVPNEEEYALNLLTERDTTNFDVAGRIRGNVKVSTKVANDTLELYSKPSFDLGTVLERGSAQENVEFERYFKAGIENVAKYTGLKNTTVETKLVYDAEVAHLPIKENQTVEIDGTKYTENLGRLLNLPKAVLNVKYDNNKLLLETNNETKFYATVGLGESTYNGEKDKKATFNAVEFETKNKAGYKLTDNLSANMMANYKLTKRFEFDDTKHELLTGAGVSYNKADFKAELNGRYNLKGEKYTNDESKEVLDLNHYVYANSKFTNTVKSGNLMVTPSLSTFVYSSIEDKYAYFGLKNDKSNESSYAGLANFGVNYLINENHKLGLALDSDYSYKLNNKEFDAYETGIDKLMNNFDGEKSKDFDSYMNEDKRAKEIGKEAGDVAKYDHRFNLTPKVNAVLKFGNVTVKPEASVKFKFGKDAKDFSLRNIEGKGTLNVEYRW